MITIIRAGIEHGELLAVIARASFLESHGHSASSEAIESFMTKSFNEVALSKELIDPNIYYHIINFNGKVAGYSKIEINVSNTIIDQNNLSKLDRMYLLKEFYGKNLGAKLFEFNVELTKKMKQKGIWLFVWIENHRAVKFYIKQGFKVVGNYNFQISKTHANPNHIMRLSY